MKQDKPFNFGVKRLSRKQLSQDCPNFKKSKKFKQILNEGLKKHDDITSNIKEHLVKQGFKCFSEYSVEEYYKTYNVKIRGKIDLVCEKSNLVIIFETKSYPLNKSSISDFLQIQIYIYLFYKHYLKQYQTEPKLIAISVFKKDYLNNSAKIQKDVEFEIGEIKISLPRGYHYVIKENLSQRYINEINSILIEKKLKIGIMSEIEYVVGDYCRYCENNSCFLKRH